MSPDAESNFAKRLDMLFKSITHPDGTEFSYEDVQKGTNKAVTAAYVWRLRTGKAANPGYGVIKALSGFFQVNPDYFFQSESVASKIAHDQADMHLAQRFQQDSVRDIALRASELDEEGRKAILGMIDYILQHKHQ